MRDTRKIARCEIGKLLRGGAKEAAYRKGYRAPTLLTPENSPKGKSKKY